MARGKLRIEIREILASSGRNVKLLLATGKEVWVPNRGTRIDLDDYGRRFAVVSRRSWAKATEETRADGVREERRQGDDNGDPPF